MSASLSDDVATRFRQAMPAAERWCWLDHAAIAPPSGPALAALAQWQADIAESGGARWGVWMARIEAARDAAARLIGATRDEIAFIPNTTWGISVVAEGLPWESGDNVVTWADEFPSNQYPWLNLASRGVEVRRLPTVGGRIDLDAFAAACDARTRLVSASWVGFAHGCRQNLSDLVEIAHRRQALLFVDAIQGLGAFPLDAGDLAIDFLAADGHKWLLGPEGAGLLYIRREHLDRLRPIGVGWKSVVQAGDFSDIELRLKPSAARYEGGTLNVAGLLALGASLDLLLSLGVAPIAERILAVTDEACERLRALGATIHSPRSEGARSGIVLFDLPGRDPIALRKRLRAAQVAVACRAGSLRISPHGYQNSADLDRFFAALVEAGAA